jgi:ABC-2 type transport system permease protein
MNPHWLIRNQRAIWARAYVRIVGANRELSWLITEVTIPVLMIMAYILIYRSIGAPKVYEALVVAGGAMIPYWIVVLWSMAAQFYWEKEMGNLDLYMASPTHPIALLLGMAIGGMFMASVRTVLIILVGIFFFDVTFVISNPLLALLIFLLTMSALFTWGMAASSIYFLVGRAGIKINMVLMEPVSLLSGIYFPIKNLGYTLAIIASIIPLSLGLDGIRQLILPGGEQLGFLNPAVEAAILAVMTVVFFGLAILLMSTLEKLGKKEGRMTLKWQ